MVPIILTILITIAVIIIIRLFGAWMLRINEIIALQKEMLDEIKKLNNS
jgi:hypothetical protein